MRTTLILSDDLVIEAKRRAADRGQSLSAVVNDALRKVLHPGSGSVSASQFTMPTFRPSVATPHDITPTELYELLAAEEQAPYQK
jgi:hypothetical protein